MLLEVVVREALLEVVVREAEQEVVREVVLVALDPEHLRNVPVMLRVKNVRNYAAKNVILNVNVLRKEGEAGQEEKEGKAGKEGREDPEVLLDGDPDRELEEEGEMVNVPVLFNHLGISSRHKIDSAQLHHINCQMNRHL